MRTALSNFSGEDALVVLDGWNVPVNSGWFAGVSVAATVEAQPYRWPVTWLAFQSAGLR